MAAGGSANIYEATYDGRKVVLKSHRCYVSFDVAQVIAVRCNHSLSPAPLTAPSQKFRNEVHVYNTLRRRGVEVVPLVGVFSTEVHPFGLVYEYMSGLCLRQYLRGKPNVRKLKLVPIPISARLLSVNRLIFIVNSWWE